jgi:Fe2+ or Zn2+ uptake regulation protein
MKLIKEIQLHGYRITQAREQICILFSEETRPLSALDILKKITIPVNKTTVYRELDFLLKHGYIHEVVLDKGVKYYELGGEHHHHIQCRKCSAIEHIHIEKEIRKLEKLLQTQTGYSITEHITEFKGVCPRCA